MLTFLLPTTSAPKSLSLVTRISVFPSSEIVFHSLVDSKMLHFTNLISFLTQNRWLRVTLVVQLNNPPNVANGQMSL